MSAAKHETDTNKASSANIFSLLLKNKTTGEGKPGGGDGSAPINACARAIYQQAIKAAGASASLSAVDETIKTILLSHYDALPILEMMDNDLLDAIAQWVVRVDQDDEESKKLFLVWAALRENAALWKRKPLPIDRIIDGLNTAAEVANVGIVLHVVSAWIAFFGAGIFAFVTAIADPAIYLFRGMVRLLRLGGRTLGFVTEEDKEGVHRWASVADAICLVLFVLAASALAGLLVAGAAGDMIGWAFALSALAIMAYFDYYHQEKMAEHQCIQTKNDYDSANQKLIAYADGHDIELNSESKRQDINEQALRIDSRFHRSRMDRAREEHLRKTLSRKLYVALIIGLTFLLVCSSAAAFVVPVAPALAIGLLVLSKLGSAILVMINLFRATNYLRLNGVKATNQSSEQSVSRFSPEIEMVSFKNNSQSPIYAKSPFPPPQSVEIPSDTEESSDSEENNNSPENITKTPGYSLSAPSPSASSVAFRYHRPSLSPQHPEHRVLARISKNAW